jgi:hypothetical protein
LTVENSCLFYHNPSIFNNGSNIRIWFLFFGDD